MEPSEIKKRIGQRAMNIILSGINTKVKSGKICCPFHNDKTPSMSWDKQNFRFHCFGCGESMDIFRFYTDFRNMNFMEAKREAANLINVKIDINEITEVKKAYKSPGRCFSDLSANAIIFGISRHISEDTLREWDIKSDIISNEEWIVFQHYDENNKLVFNSFRNINKKDFRRESGTKPILWGINKIDVEKPVLLVEGHMDMLAVYQAGYNNAVSVPSGAQDFSWIENCHEWLKTLQRVVIWADNDITNVGLKCAETIRNRIGREKTTIEVHPDFKDANEFLKCKGEYEVKKYIDEIMIEKVTGLVNMSRRKDLTRSVDTFGSGFWQIDRHLKKFHGGDLTILFGRDNEGKSTFMSQMIASVLKTDNVFLYSGELTEDRIEEWLMRQLLGSKKGVHDVIVDEWGDKIFFIKKDIKRIVKKWYEDKFYVYETKIEMTDSEKLFNIMKTGFKKFGIKFFVIDNLMTALDENSSDENKNQTCFVKKCKQFCLAFGTHIILVAHPNKVGSAEHTPLYKYHISGSKNISNVADNIIAVERIWDENLKLDDCYMKTDEKGIRYSTIVRMLKDRVGSGRNEFNFRFHHVSNRFYNSITREHEDYGIFK